MSISTARGDDGTTQVADRRTSKGSCEVEALGALDELVSALGFARSLTGDDRIRERAEGLQRVLFRVSAGIGAPARPKGREQTLPDGLLAEITTEVRELENRQGMLSDWALPGGHTAAAAFDLARTACRRAERALVRLTEAPSAETEKTAPVAPESLALLNRMSDLLWLYGRVLEHESGVNSALAGSSSGAQPQR